MPNAARVIFNEVNLSTTVGDILRGISGVIGETKRGPYNRPDILISSWAQFTRLYGGEVANNDFPLLCKRALDGGSQLRVNRVGKYTDPATPSTLTAVKAVSKTHLLTFSQAIALNDTITINNVLGVNYTFNFTTFTTSDAAMATIAAGIATNPRVAACLVLTVVGSTSNDRVIKIIPKPGFEVTGVTSSWTPSGTITFSSIAGILNELNQVLFNMEIKYPGADYNKCFITIANASNGDSSYFDLRVDFENEPDLSEIYRNQRILSSTITDARYLTDPITLSELINFSYVDTTGLSGTLNPVRQQYAFTSGSDGTATGNSDYIGDSAGGTGFFAFDAIDDIMALAVLDKSAGAIHSAGAAYAESRKDIVYFAHINNSFKSATAIGTERTSWNIDSNFVAIYGGGLVISDNQTSLSREISELGDILGLSASTDINFGEWWSFAGQSRGVINNVLGVVNNFGGAGKYNDLNFLANRQVNMVISQNSRIMLWGNFTADLENSKLSFLNIRKLVIFIKKSLKPLLYNFIEEPNDIPTWRAIHRSVKPFLDSLASPDKRALYAYRWEGDQNINSLDDLVINKRNDVDNGKYKVKLFIKPITSLQEIAIDITITPSTVSFDEIL